MSIYCWSLAGHFSPCRRDARVSIHRMAFQQQHEQYRALLGPAVMVCFRKLPFRQGVITEYPGQVIVSTLPRKAGCRDRM